MSYCNVSILKSTNSGKNYLFITKENLLSLGWKRIPNSEGRDLFMRPSDTAPEGYEKFHFLEYKSMETPKWFLNINGKAGYYDEGFYIDCYGLEYLVRTFEDMLLCERFWSVGPDIETGLNIKDEILICNEWNIKRYDPELKYYKSKYGDPKHNS